MNLNDYQNVALGTAIYPGKGTPLGLIYTALKGAGEAGEFAEHVGKAVRDDRYLDTDTKFPVEAEKTIGLTPERRALLVKELGDRLWYIAAGAAELGCSLGDVAQMNLDKLAGRAERGTLQGSGDDR